LGVGWSCTHKHLGEKSSKSADTGRIKVLAAEVCLSHGAFHHQASPGPKCDPWGASTRSTWQWESRL